LGGRVRGGRGWGLSATATPVCRLGLLTVDAPTSAILALATAVPATYAAQIVLAAHKIEMRIIMLSFDDEPV
jgi:hypothetical protein